MEKSKPYLLKEKDNKTIRYITLIDSIIMLILIPLLFYNEKTLRRYEMPLFFIKNREVLSRLILLPALMVLLQFFILIINKERPHKDNKKEQIVAKYNYKELILLILLLNVPLLVLLFYAYFGASIIGIDDYNYLICIISTIYIICLVIIIVMLIIYKKNKERLKCMNKNTKN